MLTDLDPYLTLAGQSGEPVNAVADIFWGTLISKLATRARMRPLIFSNARRKRDVLPIIAKLDTNRATIQLQTQRKWMVNGSVTC